MKRDASRLGADLPLPLVPSQFKFMTNKGNCPFHKSGEEDMEDKQIQVVRDMNSINISLPDKYTCTLCLFKEQIMTTKVHARS